jgi:hypothetical protein
MLQRARRQSAGWTHLGLWHRLAIAAASLLCVEADCESVTGIVRTCPGSTQQTERFLAEGSCGDTAVITIEVPTAGLCGLTLSEDTAVALPTSGMFNVDATQTDYVLGRGNWTLQNPPTGIEGENAGLTCTSGTINSRGGLDLDCEITVCSTVGEDLEPTCAFAGTCATHLTPVTGDAGGPTPADAGASVDGG